MKNNVKKMKYILNITLAISILSFIVALCFLLYFMDTYQGYEFIKKTWIFLIIAPIHMISLILALRYKKLGINCKKNVIIEIFLLFASILYGFGFFIMPNNYVDYNMINEYKDIINIKIPSEGSLELFEYDNNERFLRACYSKNNYIEITQQIKDNQNWISGDIIKSDLLIFIPSKTAKKEDYYSVYNKTLDNYNALPDVSGEYEIYAMRYNNSTYCLEIDIYNYSYVK